MAPRVASVRWHGESWRNILSWISTPMADTWACNPESRRLCAVSDISRRLHGVLFSLFLSFFVCREALGRIRKTARASTMGRRPFGPSTCSAIACVVLCTASCGVLGGWEAERHELSKVVFGRKSKMLQWGFHILTGPGRIYDHRSSTTHDVTRVEVDIWYVNSPFSTAGIWWLVANVSASRIGTLQRSPGEVVPSGPYSRLVSKCRRSTRKGWRTARAVAPPCV